MQFVLINKNEGYMYPLDGTELERQVAKQFK